MAAVLLLAVALFAPQGASAQAAEQARALSKTVAQCSALILPSATTPEQARQNELASEAFRKLRAVGTQTGPKACSVASDEPGNEPDTPGTEEFPDGPVGTTESGKAQAGAKVKACGDCPGSCLSAAACVDCAVGSICSPPGAVPASACRSVGITCGFFTTTYCCGCS